MIIYISDDMYYMFLGFPKRKKIEQCAKYDFSGEPNPEIVIGRIGYICFARHDRRKCEKSQIRSRQRSFKKNIQWKSATTRASGFFSLYSART